MQIELAYGCLCETQSWFESSNRKRNTAMPTNNVPAYSQVKLDKVSSNCVCFFVSCISYENKFIHCYVFVHCLPSQLQCRRVKCQIFEQMQKDTFLSHQLAHSLEGNFFSIEISRDFMQETKQKTIDWKLKWEWNNWGFGCMDGFA